MGGNEHISQRFRRLLALYRKRDGGEWGGQDLENATALLRLERSASTNTFTNVNEMPSCGDLAYLCSAPRIALCVSPRGRSRRKLCS